MGIGSCCLAGRLRGRVAPVVGVVGGLQAAPALAGVFGLALAAPHGPGLEETERHAEGFYYYYYYYYYIIIIIPKACTTDACPLGNETTSGVCSSISCWKVWPSYPCPRIALPLINTEPPPAWLQQPAEHRERSC